MSTHDRNSTLIQVDGVLMPRPSSFVWGLEDVSNSDAGRTDDSKMHKNRVAQKRKIDLTWNGLNPADTSFILNAFNPEYISVTFFDPMKNGNLTREFYVGDRSAPIKIWTTKNKRFETLSFSIIER